MATLTAKLTLTSSNATSDALNLSVSDVLTVGEPVVNISRISLVGDAAAATLFENNATTTYVYLKNTDNTNHIKYFNDTDDITAIQFKSSSGNIDAGTIKLYGIKDSQWLLIN